MVKNWLEQRAERAVKRMLIQKWIVVPLCDALLWLTGWEVWLWEQAKGFFAWAAGGFRPWY